VKGALAPVSNSDCDRGTLELRILEAVNGRPTVVFVDLSSGSCLIAALARLRGRPGVSVVTGVNLAMLVDFMFHLDLAPHAAAERAVAAACRAIKVP
jgi:mannose/fructose-specific phosphotransferase system component IIA